MRKNAPVMPGGDGHRWNWLMHKQRAAKPLREWWGFLYQGESHSFERGLNVINLTSNTPRLWSCCNMTHLWASEKNSLARKTRSLARKTRLSRQDTRANNTISEPAAMCRLDTSVRNNSVLFLERNIVLLLSFTKQAKMWVLHGIVSGEVACRNTASKKSRALRRPRVVPKGLPLPCVG